MDIYETRKRIEDFLGKEIDYFIPKPYARVIHAILDKVEGKQEVVTDGNITRTDATDATDASATADAISESARVNYGATTESESVIPTGTDGTTTTSGTEPTPK